jgi:uncharacterized protein (DUF1330 family)
MNPCVGVVWAFMEIVQRYAGTLLAADDAPQIIEGEWRRDKVVLIAFPKETAFRRSHCELLWRTTPPA